MACVMFGLLLGLFLGYKIMSYYTNCMKFKRNQCLSAAEDKQ